MIFPRYFFIITSPLQFFLAKPRHTCGNHYCGHYNDHKTNCQYNEVLLRGVFTILCKLGMDIEELLPDFQSQRSDEPA